MLVVKVRANAPVFILDISLEPLTHNDILGHLELKCFENS